MPSTQPPYFNFAASIVCIDEVAHTVQSAPPYIYTPQSPPRPPPAGGARCAGAPACALCTSCLSQPHLLVPPSPRGSAAAADIPSCHRHPQLPRMVPPAPARSRGGPAWALSSTPPAPVRTSQRHGARTSAPYAPQRLSRGGRGGGGLLLLVPFISVEAALASPPRRRPAPQPWSSRLPAVVVPRFLDGLPATLPRQADIGRCGHHGVWRSLAAWRRRHRRRRLTPPMEPRLPDQKPLTPTGRGRAKQPGAACFIDQKGDFWAPRDGSRDAPCRAMPGGGLSHGGRDGHVGLIAEFHSDASE